MLWDAHILYSQCLSYLLIAKSPRNMTMKMGFSNSLIEKLNNMPYHWTDRIACYACILQQNFLYNNSKNWNFLSQLKLTHLHTTRLIWNLFFDSALSFSLELKMKNEKFIWNSLSNGYKYIYSMRRIFQRGRKMTMNCIFDFIQIFFSFSL